MTLLARCCDVHASGEAIQSAARHVDWDRIVKLVRRHRVGGLVYHALTRAAVEVPVDAEATLAGIARAVAKSGLIQSAETARLHRRFTAAGINAVFGKGATLSQLAYRDVGRKHAKDIDMYVQPDAAAAAVELLRADGYHFGLAATAAGRRIQRFVYNQVEGLHHSSGLQVELHWRLARNAGHLALLGSTGATQQVRLSGTLVPTFRFDDLVAYLVLHGALSAWARLKWLADLNAVLRDRGEDEIVHLYAHAKALGVGRCMVQALVLRERFFGVPIPRAMAAAAASRAVQRAVVSAQIRLLDERETLDRSFGAIRLVLAERLVAEGWKDRARFWSYVTLRVTPAWLWTRLHRRVAE